MSGHPQSATRAAGFRLWFGGGRFAPAAFRHALLSARRSTSPLGDRRPKPTVYFLRNDAHPFKYFVNWKCSQ
jgi:hypothetical protein